MILKIATHSDESPAFVTLQQYSPFFHISRLFYSRKNYSHSKKTLPMQLSQQLFRFLLLKPVVRCHPLKLNLEETGLKFEINKIIYISNGAHFRSAPFFFFLLACQEVQSKPILLLPRQGTMCPDVGIRQHLETGWGKKRVHEKHAKFHSNCNLFLRGG